MTSDYIKIVGLVFIKDKIMEYVRWVWIEHASIRRNKFMWENKDGYSKRGWLMYNINKVAPKCFLKIVVTAQAILIRNDEKNENS